MIGQVPLEKFFPYILPYAEGIPKELARISLVKTAGIFCTETLLWQRVLEPQMTEIDLPMYEFLPPKKSRVVKYMRVYFGQRTLVDANENDLAGKTMDVAWRAHKGDPRYFIQRSPTTIEVAPTPTTDLGVLTALAALAPAHDADSLPEFLFDRWATVLAQGVFADVRQMEGQSFFNPQLAATYMQMFQQGVREARVEANRSQGRSTGRVNFQRIV